MKINELKERLPRGLISENGDIQYDLGSLIIEIAKDLSLKINNYIDNNHSDGNNLNELSLYSKKLDLISWCNPISTKKVTADKINSLKSMFCGPFFTSENYPWPQFYGRYAEPIAQLNLEEIEELSPVKIGSGMLQLWASEYANDEFLIRIIPLSELKKELLSPVPEIIKGEYYGDVRWGSGMLAWPEDDYKKKTPCAYEVFIIDSQRLSWPGGLEDGLGYIEDDLKDVNLIDEIKNFISIFHNDHPSTEPHLFGTFDAIQYDPIYGNRTFLALEGGPCFDWNSGNAQISYCLNDSGEVEFRFAWSCQ